MIHQTMPHTPPNRRLLKAEDVADKLGLHRTTFTKKRAGLESIGFPLPCLNKDEFGGARWDEKAIDLWLDTRLPPELKNAAAQPHFKHTSIQDQRALEAELQNRARALAL